MILFSTTAISTVTATLNLIFNDIFSIKDKFVPT